MRRILLCLLFILLILPTTAFAQRTGTIAGKVVDEFGTPVWGANVVIDGTAQGAATDSSGTYLISTIRVGTHDITASYIGYEPVTKTGVLVQTGRTTRLNFEFGKAAEMLDETIVEYELDIELDSPAPPPTLQSTPNALRSYTPMVRGGRAGLYAPTQGSENYAPVEENTFLAVADKPLSTFSIDVDAASYGNVRRFLDEGRLPEKDAVRIEELVNYFAYDYPDPERGQPFAVVTEVGPAPWRAGHRLVHVGLQAERIDTADLPPSNLVFLLDVSGSMDAPDKLPLLKKAFKLLVAEMRAQDRVAIVVYAGAAGLVLEPTAGDDKQTIFAALDQLSAGGSTAGGAGLELAYQTAERFFD